MSIEKIIKFRVGSARIGKGLTQEQLSKLLGQRSPQVVRDWEDGATMPNLGSIERLSIAFDVVPGYLFGSSGFASLRNKRPKYSGERLMIARRVRGFSQEELAEKVGVHPQALSRWECETKKPGVVYFLKLCEVLRVSPNYFFCVSGYAELD